MPDEREPSGRGDRRPRTFLGFLVLVYGAPLVVIVLAFALAAGG